MSTLSRREKSVLESFLGMGGGYVLGYSNQSLGALISEVAGLDIHDKVYQVHGDSKARKLRAFWDREPDAVVGRVLRAMLDDVELSGEDLNADQQRVVVDYDRLVRRLESAGPMLDSLRDHAKEFNADNLARQIERMQRAVESDPCLAIGTAKDLIETCCKTILAERGEDYSGVYEIDKLTKATAKALRLVPDEVPDHKRGSDVIRVLLSNLSTVSKQLAELRNHYGTGHGKDGGARGLSARHARLAVGAAATLATFLLETHNETIERSDCEGAKQP